MSKTVLGQFSGKPLFGHNPQVMDIDSPAVVDIGPFAPIYCGALQGHPLPGENGEIHEVYETVAVEVNIGTIVYLDKIGDGSISDLPHNNRGIGEPLAGAFEIRRPCKCHLLLGHGRNLNFLSRQALCQTPHSILQGHLKRGLHILLIAIEEGQNAITGLAKIQPRRNVESEDAAAFDGERV